MNPIIGELANSPMLAGFGLDALSKLAALAKPVDLPPETVIFREGEQATHIYFIISGNVALDLCAPAVGCRRILTLGSGELLGWSPALGQERLTATARAISPTRALKLSGREVLALCERDPQFGYEFMKRTALAMAKRLNATRLQLVNVYGATMPYGAEESDAGGGLNDLI